MLRNCARDIINELAVPVVVISDSDITTTGTANSFIMSRAQHRQSGTTPFTAVVYGFLKTGERSLLMVTSFIKVLLAERKVKTPCKANGVFINKY